MKLKKLVTGLFLSTALAAGVGVFAGTQNSRVNSAEAASGDTWYVRGGFNNWEARSSDQMTEDGDTLVLSIGSNCDFKIASSDWKHSITSASGGAIDNGVTWRGSSDSSINKGKYAFRVSASSAKIEPVSSKNFSSGESVYFRLEDSFKASSATCYINVVFTDDTSSCTKLTTSVTTKGSESLYKYTFLKDAYFFEINRRDSTGASNWGWSSSVVTSHSHNLFNLSQHEDWGWDRKVQISEQSASIVNVSLTQPASGGTISVKNANGSQSGAGYYYSDWSLQFTASPTSSEYYFLNWTDGSGTDWQGDDRFNNPVTLTGLSGEFGVSCKFNSYANKNFKILGSSTGTWTAQTQDIEIPLSYQSGTAGTEDGATYYSTSVSLTAGSVFKPVNITDNTYYDYDALESGAKSVKGTHIVSDGTSNKNMKVVTTAVYEIYVKSGTGAVWMQLSSQSEAVDYANTFLDAITCTDSSTTFVLDVWNNVSGTGSMEYKYSQLTSGAKNLLKDAQADKDSSDPIKQCAARYDRILSKYGYGTAQGQYHDFMGRTPSISGNGAALINNIVNGSSGSVIAIIIISSVSVAAVGGYFLFKKKHQ